MLLPASWFVHGATWGGGTLGARSWIANTCTYAWAILGRAWRRTRRSSGRCIVWWWWGGGRCSRGWADPSLGMDYEGLVQARVWIFYLAPPTHGDSSDLIRWLGCSCGVRLQWAYASSRGHLLEDQGVHLHQGRTEGSILAGLKLCASCSFCHHGR